MNDIMIETIDRELLDKLQMDFPLTARPYTEIGRGLGLSEDEAIRRIRQLKEMEIVRQIGPVLDARRLGFRTELVAMKVGSRRVSGAERRIAAHPMVSHGYEREHEMNIWFTLAAAREADIDLELKNLAEACHADAWFPLPATRLFKLNTFFGMGTDHHEAGLVRYRGPLGPARLSHADRRVINVLQTDLPLIPAPFLSLAEEAGLTIGDFLLHCQELKARGVIRRFGAAINHRQAGFNANAMTCWVVPHNMTGKFGRRLAALPQVSHCYERQTNPSWPYNLYAVVHGHEREECQEAIAGASSEFGFNDYVMLFSTREFKKERVNYPV